MFVVGLGSSHRIWPTRLPFPQYSPEFLRDAAHGGGRNERDLFDEFGRVLFDVFLQGSRHQRGRALEELPTRQPTSDHGGVDSVIEGGDIDGYLGAEAVADAEDFGEILAERLPVGIEQILEFAELGDMRFSRVEHLSSGMQQRLFLSVMMHTMRSGASSVISPARLLPVRTGMRSGTTWRSSA